MRTACLFVCVALCATHVAAQATTAHDPRLEAIADDARAAPPEFAADVLLRLVSSPGLMDPTWRRDLLEQAYLLAYGAPEPYRRIAGEIPLDSRQSAQARASDTALTRISLQVRAAQLMAYVDRARARELFEWIDLNLQPGSCELPFAPVVDEYYTALAVLARSTFDGDSTGRGDALRFFDLYMWRAQLPTEMPAVARALRRFRPTRDEALYLENTFKWVLESSLHDPRGFSNVSVDLVWRMMELEDADRKLGIVTWNVTRALRNYLIARLRGTRCADSQSDGQAVQAFNFALRARDVVADAVAPLEPRETRPSRLLARARVDPYWRTSEARRFYQTAVQLRGTGKNPTPIKERRTEAWMSQAERLLVDLEQWNSTDDAFDFVYQKGTIYTVLAELVPSGALRDRALRSFVNFLRSADRVRENRSIWVMFLDRLLELVHSADRLTVLAAMEETHHPILGLYARLEQLQPNDRK